MPELEREQQLELELEETQRQIRYLKERNELLAEWVNQLFPLGEPPYSVALFRAISLVEDPRMAIIEANEIPVSFKKCVLMLYSGEEVVGTISEELAQRVLDGQLVYVNSMNAVVAPIPDSEIPLLSGILKESVVRDVVGNLILLSSHEYTTEVCVASISGSCVEYLRNNPLVAGDRVLLFGNTIMSVLERNKLSTEKETIRKRTFQDLGGMESIRDEVLNLLGVVRDDSRWVINEDGVRKMGLSFPRGIILYGPPGCGKDAFVSALATELGWFCQVINGPDIERMWVGMTEEIMREIFKVATQNKPSILFVNEADALFSVRGSTIQSYKTDYVAQFNVLMDSVEDTSGVFVILATNRIDLLDPAIIRPGRNDKQILVPRPTREAAKKILTIYLNKHPVDATAVKDRNVFQEELIARVVDELYERTKDQFLFRAFFSDGGDKKFYFADFVSGALLESLVDQIAYRAYKRLTENMVSSDDLSYGITSKDAEGIVPVTIRDIVPRDEKAIAQWLMTNGYPRVEACHGGIFASADNMKK